MQEEKNGPVKPKVYIAIVNEIEIAVYKALNTGAEILTAAGFEHLQCHTLYQKLKGCDFEKVSLDQAIDLSNPGIERFTTKGPDVFHYNVDNEPEMTDKSELTAHQILLAKGINPNNHYLIQVLTVGNVSYADNPSQPIKMICTGMDFISGKWQDLVDIEEYGKQCKPVPPAKLYRIKVDKGYHTWPKRYITVPQLIEFEYPNNTKPVEVYKFLNTSPKPIKLKPDEMVDLTEKCLVRFTIQPKEQEDGLSDDHIQEEPVEETVKIRRDFTLPEEDIEFLDNLGLLWEAIANQPGMWVMIHDYPIPVGYNVQKAEVALLISSHYPAAEIDMAYFHPSLIKVSGRTINNVFDQVIDGKNFQGWSRHRKPGEWRPGVDNIATHLCLVDNWLVKDITR
ncbi:E2/UBC family protein [Pedobacter foliorum]|uniref:E2/UBC family protein n=1 Tax=Pedobacter foliorum TaxID=2739058 RepID=UPI0015646E50|nr:E2/UBC family protein [Pedobacter foliorum]NRF38546.1 multiubiquitin domain-containing protein [Pedobacter foliorum]